MISGSLGDGKCGVGDFSLHLARHLARGFASGKQNDRSSVCVLTATPNSVIRARHFGKREIPYGADNEWIEYEPALEIMGSVGFGIGNIARLRTRIAEKSPDLILIQYPSKGFGWTLSMPLFFRFGLNEARSRSPSETKTTGKIPVVVTIHEYKDAHPLRRLAVRSLISQASKVITPCPLEERALRRVSSGDVSVIPVGNVFAEEADENEYREFETHLDKIESGSERFAWLNDRKESIGAGDWLPNEEEASNLVEVLDVAERNSRFVFTYGHLSKSKAPMRLIAVFSRVLHAIPEAKLVLATGFDNKNKLHRRFREQSSLQLRGRVLQIGRLPAHLLRYVAEKCRVQIYTFRDGFTTKRSSAISALHFDTPLITEKAEGIELSGVECVPVGDINGFADSLIGLLSMEDTSYRELLAGSLVAQKGLAGGFSFEKIALLYAEEITAITI